jgi:threonine aldolase
MADYEIDLISDNSSKPSQGMRRYMCDARVGDEERREDPTVRELEAMVADLTGKDDAVLMPSGTMCNIVSFFVHCDPLDEILIHEESHPVYSKYAGPDVPGRAILYRVPGERGTISEHAIDDAVHSRSGLRLLSVENTHNRSGGSVWPLDLLDETCRAARKRKLAIHLDGARLLNACVAGKFELAAGCREVDSVWIDLSKGLGCPSGAVLAGSTEFISDARRAKYVFGGVMHKAGMMAAAGIYALDHNFAGLSDDHTRAQALATGLAEIEGVRLDQDKVETNIVYFDIGDTGMSSADFLARVAQQGVRFKAITNTRLRAVTHLDVTDDHVPRVIAAARSALRE